MWTAPSPSQTLIHSSPDLPPLPLLRAVGVRPQTPTSLAERRGTPSSQYYTASWGSPYQHPLSIRDGLQAIRVGEIQSSDGLEEDSSDIQFGLDHLLPRFPGIANPVSVSPAPFSIAQESGLAPVPDDRAQSRTQAQSAAGDFTAEWVRQYLSVRWSSERGNWWSDESVSSDSAEERDASTVVDGSPTGSHLEQPKPAARTKVVEDASPSDTQVQPVSNADTRGKLGKGHKSRGKNLTLKQEDFWAIVAGNYGSADTMLSSKYADPVLVAKETERQAVRKPASMVSRSPEPVSAQTNGSMKEDLPTPTRNVTIPDVSQQEALKSPSPRPRKTKVVVRGKPWIIFVPVDVNRGNPGQPPQPLSPSEVVARLKRFEDAGYDTRGFQHSGETEAGDNHDISTQNRPIYPEREDLSVILKGRNIRIRIPDRREWEAYVEYLREEKLRALGVSLSNDNSEPATSRRNSSQYPGLPFSPSPSNSFAGHPRRASVISPPLPPGSSIGNRSDLFAPSPISSIANSRAGIHQHRQSSFPVPSGLPLPQPTPPGLASWSPQQYLNRYGITRGGSPALTGSMSMSEEAFSPTSKVGVLPNHQFPFPQHDQFVDQIRQQQQQLHSQLLNQQQQQQGFGTRPPSTLEEVPEDEAENDPLAAIRLPTKADPEILNPKPRGHRHNISANLERDVSAADYHLEKVIDKELGRDGNFDDTASAIQNGDWQGKPSDANDSWRRGAGPPILHQPQPHSRAHSLTKSQQSGHDVNGDPNGGLPRDAPGAASKSILPDMQIAPQDSQVRANGTVGDKQQNSLSQSRSFPSDDASNNLRTGTNAQGNNSGHASKPSVTKLNVEAKEFKFNPNASFSLQNFGSTGFAFNPVHATVSAPNARKPNAATREQTKPSPVGSGLSVAAPAFTPGAMNGSAMPTGEFNFSSKVAAFKPDAPAFQPGNGTIVAAPTTNGTTKPPAGDSPRIFSPVDLDASKPARRSRAIPIVPPSQRQTAPEYEDKEDDQGRITQGDWRQKRARRAGDDGDEVPQFAVPSQSPETPVDTGDVQDKSDQSEDVIRAPELQKSLGSEDCNSALEADKSTAEITPAVVDEKEPAVLNSDVGSNVELGETVDDALADVAGKLGEANAEPSTDGPSALSKSFSSESQRTIGQDNSIVSSTMLRSSTQDSQTSMSATAKPFEMDQPAESTLDHDSASSQSAVPHAKGTKGKEPQVEGSSRVSANGSAFAALHPSKDTSNTAESEPPKKMQYPYGDIDGYDSASHPFVEIDAVMKHLNEEGSDFGIERTEPTWSRSSPPAEFLKGGPATELRPVVNLRSNAPSPSPRRVYQPGARQLDSDRSAPGNRDLFVAKDTPVHQRGPSSDMPLRHRDEVLSSSDVERVQQPVLELQSHVGALMDEILRVRLAPFEESLQLLQQSLTTGSRRNGSRRRGSFSGEVMNSDADDEDDEAPSVFDHRNRSPKRDRRLEKLKGVVIEAIASHYPAAAAQPASTDLSELYQAIMDIKTSRDPPGIQGSDFTTINEALADLKTFINPPAPAPMGVESIKEVVEECFNRHQQALVQTRNDTSESRISELEQMLKEAASRTSEAVEARDAAERSEAKTLQLLKLAQEESSILRQTAQDDAATLKSVEQEYREARMQIAAAEASEEALRSRIADLTAQGDALNSTLEEYRTSSTQWRAEVDRAARDKEMLKSTVSALEAQRVEGQHIRTIMRGKLEKLQSDLSAAVVQIATEKASWQRKDEERSKSYEVLSARLGAEARTRERLEREIERLEAQEKDAMRMRVVVSQTQNANTRLEEMVNSFRHENLELQKNLARAQSELHEAREGGRAEVQRTRTLLEADLEAVHRKADVTRATLEDQVAYLRSELEASRAGEENARASYASNLQKSVDDQETALSEALQSRNTALEEQRQNYEQQLKDLRLQHSTALESALDDKRASEAILNDKLGLADSKLDHLQDKVVHLEEKLEIAKSAAHAAALAAQSAKAPAPHGLSQGPEKISPQALRESIVVLQEQLHEREGRIEQLEQQLSGVDADLPAKLKEREVEVGWLRELLGVRIDDLTDLVNALSHTVFDRDAVRDAAIRIRANLQMEQQEKERVLTGSSNFPSLASISNFASPKAVQLAAALGSWRKGKDAASSSRAGSLSAGRGEARTPSKLSPSAHNFLSGLMTPPASNLRRTPTPQASLSPRTRQSSLSTMSRSSAAGPPSVSRLSDIDDGPKTPPYLRQGSYDQDAEDGDYGASGFFEETATGGLPDESNQEMFGPGLR